MTSSIDALVTSTNSAMAIVTASTTEARDGCLVGFHSQCSIEPERYAIWLSKANLTYRVALLASHLGVHLLSSSDRDLAERFGTLTGDDVDKLSRCAWHRGAHDVVVIDQLPHHFIGERKAVIDTGGDHVCFVLEPVATGAAGPCEVLRFEEVSDLSAGHQATDRPWR